MTSSSIQSGNNGSKTRRFSASFKVGITADTRGMPSELTGDTTLFTMSETRLIAESPPDVFIAVYRSRALPRCAGVSEVESNLSDPLDSAYLSTHFYQYDPTLFGKRCAVSTVWGA